MKTKRNLTIGGPEFSDVRLFRSIKEGDYEAMDIFFNRYYNSLCRFGLLYESNADIVEEEVADVFIQLWNRRERLDEVMNPRSYVYVMTKNRMKKRVKTDHYHESMDETSGLKLALPSVEEQIIEKEQKEIDRSKISEILDDIPKKSRLIFELSRVDGLKYREISELLNISPRTVENHMATAIKSISRSLLAHNRENR